MKCGKWLKRRVLAHPKNLNTLWGPSNTTEYASNTTRIRCVQPREYHRVMRPTLLFRRGTYTVTWARRQPIHSLLLGWGFFCTHHGDEWHSGREYLDVLFLRAVRGRADARTHALSDSLGSSRTLSDSLGRSLDPSRILWEG